MAPLTYWLGRNLVKIRVFSIVNILAGEKLVPELIQKEFNADRLAQEAGRLMSSPDDRSRLRRRFVEIKDGLGSEPASINAAQELYALLTGARRSGPSEGIPSSARPKRR
jgi:lipid-A-disaccharide synthase